MLTVAIDIDGTLRDFKTQVLKYIEIDYPKMFDKVEERGSTVYPILSPDDFKDGEEEEMAWVYENRVFELFGLANRIHPKVIEDLNIFTIAAEKAGYELWIASVQRGRSIPATLHWLSKWGCRVPRIRFFPSMQAKVDAGFDIYVDDCPSVIEQTMGESFSFDSLVIPTAIKIPYPFTEKFDVPELDTAEGKFNDLYDILGVKKMLPED